MNVSPNFKKVSSNKLTEKKNSVKKAVRAKEEEYGHEHFSMGSGNW